ncbi:MAG: serine/threonine-protein kinase [Proteobacteria bacterium]|nr:serine/threonine-protein kinase [Pseudomonadota bacterium]
MSNLALDPTLDSPGCPVPVAAPISAVDLLFDAALASGADFAWIEPMPESEGLYVLSLEREGHVLSTATIDAYLAAAMIARLAFICGVDLTAAGTSTGSTRVRAGTFQKEIVFTLRPGNELRGEIIFVRRAPRLVAVGECFSDLEQGDRVGHYKVITKLGAGGMGSVYRVEHVALGRIYALKVLHGTVLQRDAHSIDRFLREARAAARIQHPNIVDVFDFGYVGDGRPYFVMELLPGLSLCDLVDQEVMAPARAVQIARQLCEALAAAHDHGVIHADVTPANVLVEETPHLNVKLVDFGLAELRDRADTASDDAEYVLGTPCYISPEQIRGARADERSDQYSLGIVMFEMLTGRAPFQDRSVRELCLKHIRDPIPEMLSPHGPLPDELVRIVERCMAKSPSARFSNMRAMLAELDEVARLVERRGWRRWLAP